MLQSIYIIASIVKILAENPAIDFKVALVSHNWHAYSLVRSQKLTGAFLGDGGIEKSHPCKLG